MALVLDGRGFRDITFSDAVKLQTETVRADWPVKGPRTLPWVLGFMLRMAGGAMAWHNRWIAMMQLGESDENVKLHETLCRVLEAALCRDQLVICELASYEYLARQLQLVERVFEERARRSQPVPKAKAQAKELGAAGFGSEVGHFFGAGETKGNVCICPALMDWIADQMKMEASVAKERRKAREERALTLARMGLTSLFPSLVSLARIAQRPSRLRLVWTRPRVVPIASATFFRYLVFLWMGAAIFRWAALLVCALPKVGGDPPAVQAASVDYLSSLHREFELPAAYSERSSACEAPLVEMLAQAPGYAGDSGRVRPYSQPLAAWPKSTKAVSISDVVSDAGSIALQGWRQTTLNSESVAAGLRDALGIQRPYVDPELRYQPKSHAQFSKQLEAHDMISWRAASSQSSHTIGLFFVEKSNHVLRLVFDTRLANCSFATPPATKLPTPSAWASVDCDDSFVFAQGDIQCAFYHLRLPPGMESLFSLPAISNRHIGLTSINGRPVGIHGFVQPLVTVVPMGWSWALHFCQSALVRALTDAGFDSGDMIVDGGLPVLEFSEAVSKGVFTGLQIDGDPPPDLVSEVGRAAEKWRRLSGVTLACGLRLLVRWVPSERNVADKPSREGFFVGPSFEEVIKTARARKTHPGPSSLSRGSLSVLEAPAVSASTGRNYHDCAQKFLSWCLWTARDFSCCVDLDTVLAVYFVHLFLDGYDSATGRTTLAALKHHLPSMLVGSRPLPRAFSGAARMRLPLPRVAMFAIVGVLLAQGRLSEAVFVRLAFDTYLRPSEAYRLTAASLIAPRVGSRGGYQHWAILVNDAASGRPGKTGVTDESAIVDDPSLWPLLAALRDGRRPEANLWTFSPEQVRQAFRAALAMLQLDGEQTSLHSLRRGGASDDLLSGRRTRKEVKDRGRWRTDQSLNRYGKRARMQQRLGLLSPALVDFGDKVEARLLQLMEVTARTGIFPLRLPPLVPASAPAAEKTAPKLTDQWRFD
ncbi:unnamed protein product [Prorocentrum cordatum]|uniref:RNA-dependent RNA polymerase n=1 Tax=Prorocentrum cordatum TaxID=2364126 RepID=A0ABN9SZU6_9DINO|nr:unnamed protein product [Polarella glacialis]